MSAHLGRRVSALVDDQLPADERERALRHLVDCRECRSVVDSERRAKLTLQTLEVPAPSPAMLAGLLQLAGPSGPLPRPRSNFPAPPGRPASWTRRPGGGPPTGRPGTLRRTASRPVGLAVAAVTVAGATLGLAFVAGGAAPAPVVPAFTNPTTPQRSAEAAIDPLGDVARVVTSLSLANPSPGPAMSAFGR